ncbi:hypothetical protein LAZ67_4001776 [Cordylochernes scorpioides]|uniref:Reverse transcriptase domain-containing protein n=1 Tax=Cordylochernes scorpioides TaxID=51811 RepID=A0ABY6KE28_9ARAC|nr:hypothetical protein LAZ67_4001776 [Cordylochernes scorpioides]
MLRSRLNEWEERRNVIPENQAGFRRGRTIPSGELANLVMHTMEAESIEALIYQHISEIGF